MRSGRTAFPPQDSIASASVLHPLFGNGYHQARLFVRLPDPVSYEQPVCCAALWYGVPHDGHATAMLPRTNAHEVLAPFYNWFTEGCSTADLKQAKTLLHEIA